MFLEEKERYMDESNVVCKLLVLDEIVYVKIVNLKQLSINLCNVRINKCFKVMWWVVFY